MGHSKLKIKNMSRSERLHALRENGIIDEEFDRAHERSLCGLAQEMSNSIENSIGLMPVPVGVATNFVINGRPTVVPIATEERGIISACSKAAKMCLPTGFSASAHRFSSMMGEIIFAHQGNELDATCLWLQLQTDGQERIQRLLNDLPPENTLTLLDFNVHTDDGLAVVDVRFTTRNTMGAGRVTRLAEQIGEVLTPLADIEYVAAICSNLESGWQVRSSASWETDEPTAERIMLMQKLASRHRPRNITHLKGIMNAMAGVALATGQDYRAILATFLEIALRQPGQSPMTKYDYRGGKIFGELEAWVPVGEQGGACQYQFPRIYQEMISDYSASQLAATIATAGLAANFGALHCLVTDGLSAGHAKTRK